jgi:hypothetical protein
VSKPVPLPFATLRGLGLAAGSGAFATAALALSPFGSQVPPVYLPYTQVDVGLLVLPVLFAAASVMFARSRWPWPALALPSLALGLAAAAHWQASALLGLFTNLPGTEAGTRVDLVRVGCSGASLLLALAASLERGQQRFLALAREAGVLPGRAAHAARVAELQGARTLGFTGAAFVALLFAARVGDSALGGARAPVPELVGAALAVGVAVLLFPRAAKAHSSP